MRLLPGLLCGLLLAPPPPAAAQTASQDSILALARRWLGPATLERLQSLRAVAAVQGPRGPIQTVIRSRLAGLTRFEQFDDRGPLFIAGVGRRGPWTWSVREARADTLSAAGASVITGHEFHLLVAYPERRWTPRGSARLEVAEGDTLWRLEFTDRLGAPVAVRYAQDGRPVDLLLVNHSGAGSPEVRVRVFDWPADEPRLFRYAVILHGSDTWLYHYLMLEPDSASTAVFEPSPPVDGPKRREREEGCP